MKRSTLALLASSTIISLAAAALSPNAIDSNQTAVKLLQLDPQQVVRPELQISDPIDTVWFDETSIRELVHTVNFHCTDPTDCPSCWEVVYTPAVLDIPSQKPQSIGLSAHNLVDAAAFSHWSQTGTLSATGTAIPLVDSEHTISMQIVVQFRGDYDTAQGYDATVQIKSADTCPGITPSTTPLQLTVPLHVDPPSITLRKEVLTYFYNTYIPTAPHFDDKSRSPKSLDPTRSHAELQISAWYNWEMKPEYDPLDPAQGKPNMLDLRIYGQSYFVINNTYSLDASSTICWINSLPVLVEINTRTNQTIHIYTQPRFDMHNPQAAMAQPLPFASADVDVFSSRFFFEFACQDRLKIIYDPTTIRNELLVLAVGHKDPDTGTITFRADRYPQSLAGLQTYVHGPTPNEVLGRAYYDATRNVFICQTTIDFHETAWLDDTKNNLNIVAGIDGVTYSADAEDAVTPLSAALLSILADSDTYPDINPDLKLVFQHDSTPLLFISDVSATGVQGPYISFRLPTMRPYPDTWPVTPSSRIQVNIIFQVQKPIFRVKEPSCTIIMDNLRAGDARLSYSTSQYMNSTINFFDDKNQQALQQLKQNSAAVETTSNQGEEVDQTVKVNDLLLSRLNPTRFKQIEPQTTPSDQTRVKTWLSSLDQLMKDYLPSLVENVSHGVATSRQQEGTVSAETQSKHNSFTAQGYNFPTHTDLATGITVTSQLQESLKIKISNPNQVDFDYISINALPGLNRIAFTSSLKNDIHFDEGDEWEWNQAKQPEESTITTTMAVQNDDKKPKLSSNGEQYLVSCHFNTNRELKLTGGLSVYAREFQIGPFHHFISKEPIYEIECPGVVLIPELLQSISDYDYPTETILDEHYPLTKTFNELKLVQYQHFITFSSILEPETSSAVTQPPQTPLNSLQISSLFQSESAQFSTLQQPIQSQVYLTKVVTFSMDAPQKTYKRLILGIIGGVIALIVALLLCLPLHRYLEVKRDTRRQASVKIEEIGMNNLVPFEELNEE